MKDWILDQLVNEQDNNSLGLLISGSARRVQVRSEIPLDVCNLIVEYVPPGKYIEPNDEDVNSVIFGECSEELKIHCLNKIKKQMDGKN